MRDWRQIVAMVLAVAAGAALLGLGYWYGSVSCGQRLEQAKADADRFNREAANQKAINARLLTEMDQLRQAMTATKAKPTPDAGQEFEDIKGRVLRRGEAALLLGGDLIVTLEAIADYPPRARLRLQDAEGRRGVAVLEPGGEAKIKAAGRTYRLILKKVTTGSVIIALLAG